MADEITRLIIQVQSTEAETAKKRLKDLGYEATEAEKAVGGLSKASAGFMSTVKGLLGPLATFISVTAGISKLVNTSRQFETLSAQLKTATGSAENAVIAFEALQQFATTTPYDLAQTVDAFIKLTNLGLTPSERALRSYGNTASAMGKDLEAFVLAVSNATVGEFMTLRQFGIKARTEAEGVRFIFRGTSTLVKNDAKAIEDYFIKLGESKFANSMAEKMKTLDGAISNLGDAWDVMFATIGAAGAGDLIKSGIQSATEAIQQFTDMINSGEIAAWWDLIVSKFDLIGDGFYNLVTNIIGLWQMGMDYLTGDGKAAATTLVEIFILLPENLRAVAQAIGATFALTWESMVSGVRMSVEQIINFFNYLAATAENIGKEIWSHLVPGAKDFDYTKAQAQAFEQFATKAKDSWNGASAAFQNAGQAWEEEIVAIMDEWDKNTAASDRNFRSIEQLREAYKKLKADRAAAAQGTDRLERFALGSNEHIASDGEKQRFDALRAQLQLEEITIKESYDKRLALIRDNTEAGSDLRLELETALNKAVTAEYEKAFQDRGERILKIEAALYEAIAAGRLSEVETLTAALQLEEERIKESYERRRQLILDDTSLTEEQRLKLLTDLERKYAQQQQQQELARQKATLKTTADFFGNIATMASMFGKKGAKIAKAAAITQATIKTYESATSAYAAMAGIPYIGPVLGAAAAGAAIAAGMANIAQIKSQDYSGAYDTGGMIPAGKWGIAGENGPEAVRGPAIVQSRRSTADRGEAGASPEKITLVINHIGGGEAEVRESRTSEGRLIEVTVARTKAELARDVQRGGDPVSKAFEQNYNLRRTGRAA